MVDFATVLAALKLARDLMKDGREEFTAHQRAKLAQQSRQLLNIATTDEIQRYDTPERLRIRRISAVAKKRPRKSAVQKKAVVSVRKSSARDIPAT